MKRTMPKAFHKRLAKCLDDSPMTDVAIAERLGTANTRISEWRHGVKIPSLPAIHRLCRVLRINAHWLLYGTGPRERP